MCATTGATISTLCSRPWLRRRASSSRGEGGGALIMAEAVHPHAPLAGERQTPAAEPRPGGPRESGFKLGRIAGVEIRVDWSLAIVFWLIALNLGLGLFPALHPGWSPVLSWSVAIAAALLFFLSILAHEMAHALV